MGCLQGDLRPEKAQVLNGGERSISIAFMAKPKLLLDELFAGLARPCHPARSACVAEASSSPCGPTTTL